MLPELERSIDNEITNKIEDNNTIETTPKIKTTILALKPPSKHQKPLKKKRTTTILKQDNKQRSIKDMIEKKEVDNIPLTPDLLIVQNESKNQRSDNNQGECTVSVNFCSLPLDSPETSSGSEQPDLAQVKTED